jgi:hypothetical protein
MGSLRKNSRRPQVEQLEHRCTPGSVLDVLGDPLLTPLGQSLVPLEATEATVSVATANQSLLSGPQQAAANVDSTLSSDGQGMRGIWGQSTVIGGPLPAPSASVSPQDNMILASPVAAGEQVPFKGSLEGVETITPLTPPFISVLLNATGNATQLGQFTLVNPHIVNVVTHSGSGTYEFTAANGDTLTAAVSGLATPTATPGVISIVETGTISGGTGRFAGATGTFTVTRLESTVTHVTTGSFEGMISSPGASKR